MKKIKEFLNKSTTQTKILIIVVISVLFLISYGLWTEYNSGEIDILVPYQGSLIFLDGKELSTTNYDDQIVTLKRIRPGEHSILVYANKRYPWEKTAYIKKGNTTKMYPFLMMTELIKKSSNTLTKLTENELSKIEPLFKEQNKNNFISFLGDGGVEIKKENNSILATWINDVALIPDFFCDNTECKKTINIFTSEVIPIKTIGFYPKRENVVIFSLDNSIYAIEIGNNSAQNFQPIYTGENPDFAIDSQTSSIYIKDGDLAFGVKL